jgi:hypothetical protein
MNWFRRWWGQDDADFNEYLNLPHQHPHWTASFLRKAFGFCKREWKWVLATCGAVIAFLPNIRDVQGKII